MTGIDTHLKTIKDGVFGRDVRQAIYDGIEQVYKDATFDGNTNMEVAKARGRHETLSARLASIDGELASEHQAIRDIIKNLGSGSPKGVYANLRALQSAKPAGDDGIFVTSDNGHWWYWSEGWKDGGAYLAEPNTKDWIGLTVDIKFSAGEYFDVNHREIRSNATVTSTGYIELSGFQNVIYTEIFESGSHHAAFFDSNKTFISGVISNRLGPWEIPIPSGAKYANIAYYNSEIDRTYIKMKNVSSIMDFIEQELFKIRSELGTSVDFDILPGEYFSVYTKRIEKHSDVSSTDYIDVEQFKEFVYTVISQNKNYHAAFFDSNKTFISGTVSNRVGQWAIPIPPDAKYVKIAFYNVDLSSFYVRNIAQKNLAEAIVTPSKGVLTGKKIGIIGDSISTYKNQIAPGFSHYYPAFDVQSVEQTWWQRLIDNTGMKLCVNASWSGSTITGNQDNTSGIVGCSDARVNALTAINGDVPDIIIVYIGINDFAKNNGIICGEYRGKTVVSNERTVTSISEAFGILLSKLQAKYPNTRIFVSRIMPERYAGSMAESHLSGFPNINPNDNVSLPEFNEQIEEIASAFNCPVIPMDKFGITFFNVNQYTGDNLHPNAECMIMMANIVQKTIEKYIF